MYVRAQTKCSGMYEHDTSYHQFGGAKYHFKKGEKYDFCPMDNIEPVNMLGLKMVGDQMWNEQKDRLELVLRNIIDERWGP